MRLKPLIIVLIFISTAFLQTASADVLNLPIKRSISTQPINTLEVVSVIKNTLNGRILSVKKKATYTNPDCHLVKFLEDKGEFQLIAVGCRMETFANSKSHPNS